MSQITVLVDVELTRVRFQFWGQVHVFGVDASGSVGGRTGKLEVSFDRSRGRIGGAKRHLLSAECSWCVFAFNRVSRRGFG